jgi:hypothetical protein
MEMNKFFIMKYHESLSLVVKYYRVTNKLTTKVFVVSPPLQNTCFLSFLLCFLKLFAFMFVRICLGLFILRTK